MTGPPDDHFERQLREVLRAEVDSVQPSGEGLERIRERTAQRGLDWMAWLRPAMAVAASVAIIGTIVLASPALREHIAPSPTAGVESATEQTDWPPPPPEDPTHTSTEPVEEPGSKEEPAEPDGTVAGGGPEDEPTEETQVSATAAEECSGDAEEGSPQRDSSAEDGDEGKEDNGDCDPDDSEGDDPPPTDEPTESPSPDE